MNGFIVLHRKITVNSLYFSEQFTRMQAWIDLLLLASFKKQFIFIKYTKIMLEPGELCYSQRLLAKRWKWNRKKVSEFLSLLCEENMITTKTSKLTTVIKIINWELYQGTKPQLSHSNSHYNNINNVNKEEEIILNNLPPGCV